MDAVEKIKSLCDSITQHSLACQRLEPNEARYELTDVQSLIEKEIQTAQWLDSQVADFRAAIQRRGGDEAETKEDRAAKQEKHDDLVEATVQKHQEYLLLHRFQQASNCVAPTNPNERFLTAEALKSRKGQVSLCLQKQETLSQLRKEVQLATEHCRQIQEENKQLWRQVHTLEKSKGGSQMAESIAPASIDRLEKERTILKRTLADLIVGNRFDLHHNKRLRSILMKVAD